MRRLTIDGAGKPTIEDLIMGEAKRRKAKDPNYGKTPPPFFDIENYPETNKFVIKLHYKDDSAIISTHSELSCAQFGLTRCNDCLLTFSQSETKPPLYQWFSRFVARLITQFDYPDDYGVAVSVKKKWVYFSKSAYYEKPALEIMGK